MSWYDKNMFLFLKTVLEKVKEIGKSTFLNFSNILYCGAHKYLPPTKHKLQPINNEPPKPYGSIQCSTWDVNII